MENEETQGNESTTTTKPAGEDRGKAHEIFLAALQATARANGLTYEEKAGWHKWTGPGNKQKVVVAKQAKEVTVVETTLGRDLLGEDITKPLDKPNGKIECRIVPTLENVQMALEMLADPSTPQLRAAKRLPKSSSAQQ